MTCNYCACQRERSPLTPLAAMVSGQAQMPCLMWLGSGRNPIRKDLVQSAHIREEFGVRTRLRLWLRSFELVLGFWRSLARFRSLACQKPSPDVFDYVCWKSSLLMMNIHVILLLDDLLFSPQLPNKSRARGDIILLLSERSPN